MYKGPEVGLDLKEGRKKAGVGGAGRVWDCISNTKIDHAGPCKPKHLDFVLFYSIALYLFMWYIYVLFKPWSVCMTDDLKLWKDCSGDQVLFLTPRLLRNGAFLSFS